MTARGGAVQARAVEVPLPDGGVLEGDLVVPTDALGLVVFAHGSGSSRHSPRNSSVAGTFQAEGMATLLIDLLTAAEEQRDVVTGELRFGLDLLAGRLVAVVRWASRDAMTAGLPIGLFGASTGGGAALVAAAGLADTVRAVVSRGGRPDLAGDALPLVRCPVLLLVGERDEQVVRLNQQAGERLTATLTELVIVPRATHLFEEPGALQQVAGLAADWFRRHLTGPAQPALSPDLLT